MGLPAYSRSTNRNTATGSGRSPWRRRLRLFLESRAPRKGSSLLVGVAVALRAPVLSSLLARLRRSRPAEPTCAATPRQFRDPGRSLSWVCRSHARDERPRHETQVAMVDAFAACLNLLDGHLSDTSLLCPPNRVKLSLHPRRRLSSSGISAQRCSHRHGRVHVPVHGAGHQRLHTNHLATEGGT